MSFKFDESYDYVALAIKYHSDITPIEYNDKGDWIDLRSAGDVKLSKGDFKLINLGVSVVIPEEYEMHIVPRSSTFKNYGIIQTNSMGIVDHTYCGENDILMMPVFATRDCEIAKNDRICQFRLEKRMEHVIFKTIEFTGHNDRGGFGSTGKSDFVEHPVVSENDNLVRINIPSFERENSTDIQAYMLRCEFDKVPAIVKTTIDKTVGVLKSVSNTYCMVELNSYGKELYENMTKPIIITNIGRTTDPFIFRGSTVKQVTDIYMAEGILFRD